MWWWIVPTCHCSLQLGVVSAIAVARPIRSPLAWLWWSDHAFHPSSGLSACFVSKPKSSVLVGPRPPLLSVRWSLASGYSCINWHVRMLCSVHYIITDGMTSSPIRGHMHSFLTRMCRTGVSLPFSAGRPLQAQTHMTAAESVCCHLLWMALFSSNCPNWVLFPAVLTHKTGIKLHSLSKKQPQHGPHVEQLFCKAYPPIVFCVHW